MIKKIVSIACMILLISPAIAGIDQGIDKGMTHLSLLGGVAVPASEYKTDGLINGEKLEYGSAAGAYGIQIMHYIAPAFGLGIEFNGQNYSDAEQSISIIGVGKEEQKSSSDIYQFMLAGKVNFAPAAKTRLYLPFGVGFARYTLNLEGIEYDAFGVQVDSGKAHRTSTKPSFYAGLGVETDLNDIFILGFEARYNGFWIDKEKFDNETKYLSNVNLMLKLGVKF